MVYVVQRRAVELETEADAYEFLEQLRWGDDGPTECPHCLSDKGAWFLKPKDPGGRKSKGGSSARSQRRVWKCRENSCRRQFSVLTNTVMHATKLPVRAWVGTVFDLCTEPNGVSAHDIASRWDVTTKSAWAMLNRIEEALAIPDTERAELSTRRPVWTALAPGDVVETAGSVDAERAETESQHAQVASSILANAALTAAANRAPDLGARVDFGSSLEATVTESTAREARSDALVGARTRAEIESNGAFDSAGQTPGTSPAGSPPRLPSDASGAASSHHNAAPIEHDEGPKSCDVTDDPGREIAAKDTSQPLRRDDVRAEIIDLRTGVDGSLSDAERAADAAEAVSESHRRNDRRPPISDAESARDRATEASDSSSESARETRRIDVVVDAERGPKSVVAPMESDPIWRRTAPSASPRQARETMRETNSAETEAGLAPSTDRPDRPRDRQQERRDSTTPNPAPQPVENFGDARSSGPQQMSSRVHERRNRKRRNVVEKLSAESLGIGWLDRAGDGEMRALGDDESSPATPSDSSLALGPQWALATDDDGAADAGRADNR